MARSYKYYWEAYYDAQKNGEFTNDNYSVIFHSLKEPSKEILKKYRHKGYYLRWVGHYYGCEEWKEKAIEL